MYSYYSNEVNKALDLEDHERVGYLIQDMPYEILVALRKKVYYHHDQTPLA